DIESLVLSGRLFSDSRSSSPERTPSPDNTDWPELNDDDNGFDYDSDKERSKQIDRILSQQQAGASNSVGVGVPGRTGVKGVIRDKREADRNARDHQRAELDELNKKMERAALSARTYREEEEERMWERHMLEGGGSNGAMDFFGTGGKTGRFGHLREVGVEGFLPAIESEDRNTWVVVHLYAPSLDRCYALDETLVQLARRNPDTKFLRCKAGALGFASASSSSRPAPRPSTSIRTARRIPGGLSTIDDEDDPFGDTEADEDGEAYDEDGEVDEDDDIDLDMLPTMLVYRGGDLVYNWVRVDLEAGRGAIEELLIKCACILLYSGCSLY
ncbi:hypothetical protein GLOTRDRAFT_34048, partial [Gloeophyllum trabeum ATCC 11539]